MVPFQITHMAEHIKIVLLIHLNSIKDESKSDVKLIENIMFVQINIIIGLHLSQ